MYANLLLNFYQLTFAHMRFVFFLYILHTTDNWWINSISKKANSCSTSDTATTATTSKNFQRLSPCRSSLSLLSEMQPTLFLTGNVVVQCSLHNHSKEKEMMIRNNRNRKGSPNQSEGEDDTLPPMDFFRTSAKRTASP